MEANNVEDYLQSARQIRTVHHPSITSATTEPLDMVHKAPQADEEDPVFNGDLEVEVPVSRGRRPVYHPCTIPQQRDQTKVQLEQEGEEPIAECSVEQEKPSLPISSLEVRDLYFDLCCQETCFVIL